jgi:hypothetical protein
MICAHCGKVFNHGPAQHKKIDGEKRQSFMFCSEDCRKMYG